jgi:hypothetical protein
VTVQRGKDYGEIYHILMPGNYMLQNHDVWNMMSMMHQVLTSCMYVCLHFGSPRYSFSGLRRGTAGDCTVGQ